MELSERPWKAPFREVTTFYTHYKTADSSYETGALVGIVDAEGKEVIEPQESYVVIRVILDALNATYGPEKRPKRSRP